MRFFRITFPFSILIPFLFSALFLYSFSALASHTAETGPQTRTTGVSVTIEEGGAPPPPPPPPPVPGGGGYPPIVIPPVGAFGDVVFQGRAYPASIVTITRNGGISSRFVALADGTFSHELKAVPTGISAFGLYAQDSDGRISPTVNISISIAENTRTTIAGIFIPPTISVPAEVARNGFVPVRGQSFPQSDVVLFFHLPGNPSAQTKANEQGKWQTTYDLEGIADGEYSVRAKAIAPDGSQSEFSETKIFRIVAPELVECANGDLNGDGRVDIFDFSIMMFWWGTDNGCADQNNDGRVDIIDFSIMLYWWSG